jgi:hypothetical protein
MKEKNVVYPGGSQMVAFFRIKEENYFHLLLSCRTSEGIDVISRKEVFP